jgi:hypothetical protein
MYICSRPMASTSAMWASGVRAGLHQRVWSLVGLQFATGCPSRSSVAQAARLDTVAPTFTCTVSGDYVIHAA